MKITVSSLCKSYEGKKTTGTRRQITQALRDCSLETEGSGFTVVAGRSGCGKTTLLKIIAGLERADSGTVEFLPIKNSSTENTAGNSVVPKIGFMFQDPRLLPWLSVEQNLALAFRGPKSNAEKAAIREKIQQTLAMVGLADRAASLPRELSGGMAQRCALARSLCREPDILLLDEPLSSLDAFTRAKLRDELERLWQHLGITVILVTHDIEEAVFFGDRVFLMNEGAIEKATTIPMPRPRDCRTAEFQEYCRKIEGMFF